MLGTTSTEDVLPALDHNGVKGRVTTVVGTLFKRIVINIVGQFAETNRGNKYVLVAIDYFFYAEAYTVSHQEAATIAETLVKDEKT